MLCLIVELESLLLPNHFVDSPLDLAHWMKPGMLGFLHS